MEFSVLSVAALTTNTVVDRRGSHAQLPCQTRRCAVPAPKVSTRVSPRKRKGDFGWIQLPRASRATREQEGLKWPTMARVGDFGLKTTSDGAQRHAQQPRLIPEPPLCGAEL